jgi:hypothetical protein
MKFGYPKSFLQGKQNETKYKYKYKYKKMLLLLYKNKELCGAGFCA